MEMENTRENWDRAAADYQNVFRLGLNDYNSSLLHFWQSYTRDFQPQGRYVLTLIIPLAYLFSAGTDKLILPVFPSKEKKSDVMNPAVILTGTWLMMFAAVAVGTMSKMIL